MSWPNRALLLLIPLLLAGCGFQPLYGKQSTGSAEVLSGVAIDSIPGRMGQQFRQNLEDKLNPSGAVPAHPTYRLTATVQSAATPIGVARDGTVSRYNVYLDSEYALVRISDGTKVSSGKLRHVSSYSNIPNEYFSTYMSEADAIKRGITELSEVYRQRLSSYLAKDDKAPIARN